MAINANSETGFAEDLVRSIVQFGCAEFHAKTLYEKATAELENGLVDTTDEEVLQKQLEKIDQYKSDANSYADIRRQMMRKLLEMFPNHSKELWCQVKHLGVGAMQAWEAYEGSDDDPDLLHMAYEANKLFVSVMTRFLGAEISDCAACLSDFLKGIEKGEIDEEAEAN